MIHGILSEMAFYETGNNMVPEMMQLFILLCSILLSKTETIQVPSFSNLRDGYPGYRRYGGNYTNHQLIDLIGCGDSKDILIHDTSALRLSFSFNEVAGLHSLGKEMIRLSKYGRDSVEGSEGLQFIYHPIAYGPYLADKYGYPIISKLHQKDPKETKKNFWGKQGILRVITYTKDGNIPKGHVALWDCNHFHQSKDWISGHTLITAEFWESPDSSCPSDITQTSHTYPLNITADTPWPKDMHELLKHRSFRRKIIKKYYLEKEQSRHHRHQHDRRKQLL